MKASAPRRKAAVPWTDGLDPPATRPQASGAAASRRKFLRFFPAGFRNPQYVAWERGYKWTAHLQWQEALPPETIRRLLREKQFHEIAQRAVRIEARTNLLFSFEKMALRDAVKSAAGAERFARGLSDLLSGPGSTEERLGRWCEALAQFPRRQTRVLTWPLATIFGFIAQPDRHFFLKPNVTRRAAQAYGLEFPYQSRPGPEVYRSLLTLAARIRADLADLEPRDMIDLQSFLWVLGSDEYD